jgi:hypothetical protein
MLQREMPLRGVGAFHVSFWPKLDLHTDFTAKIERMAWFDPLRNVGPCQREARGYSAIQRAYDGRSFVLFSRNERIMLPRPFLETRTDRACRSGSPVQ